MHANTYSSMIFDVSQNRRVCASRTHQRKLDCCILLLVIIHDIGWLFSVSVTQTFFLNQYSRILFLIYPIFKICTFTFRYMVEHLELTTATIQALSALDTHGIRHLTAVCTMYSVQCTVYSVQCTVYTYNSAVSTYSNYIFGMEYVRIDKCGKIEKVLNVRQVCGKFGEFSLIMLLFLCWKAAQTLLHGVSL